jgi:hypothetical protein
MDGVDGRMSDGLKLKGGIDVPESLNAVDALLRRSEARAWGGRWETGVANGTVDGSSRKTSSAEEMMGSFHVV